jgi:5-methylcytosine-specific restriction endonuclease McrA
MSHKDPEVRRAYHARWYREHRAEQLAAKKAHYEADRPAARAAERAWASRHPETARLHRRRHNANRRGRTGGVRVTIADLRDMPQVCVYCGATENLTLKHLTPLVRGGTNDRANLAIACRDCNYRKGPRTAEEFRGAA